jgi:endo-1,4-beta-D-glucanase Y
MTLLLRSLTLTFCSGLAALACSASEDGPELPGFPASGAGGSDGSGTGGFGGVGGGTQSGGRGGAILEGNAGATLDNTGAGGAASAQAPVSLALLQAEALDRAGPYSATISSPFSGVGLYADEDAVSFSFTFPNIPGAYRVDVTGASSSTGTARLELLLGTASRASFDFSGTALQVDSAELTLVAGAPATQTLTLRAVGDDGSWDLYLDQIEIFYLGQPAPPPPRPQLPTDAVAQTGIYRNLFVELGKSPAEVDARVEQVVNQLYYGGEDERLYYESGTDEAYFYTADTDDVRSEGVSYGMMFSVQLGKRQEFDRLWKFAKTRMQHQTGDRTGYFAWRVRADGTQLDANPAPDGEEYFAMSLLMAARRWGDGTGIFNYTAEANLILDHMLNHRALTGLPEFSGIANMIDPVENQVVFSIEGQSATFTDPSYHLPHFYELFGQWAAADNQRWFTVADESRQLFQDAAHELTGLAPDYSLFDGTPTGGTHAQFRFDAWRVAMNIALDSTWWNQDPWQRDTWVDNYLGFFAAQGVSSHRNQFNVDGTNPEGDHSPGLVAMNAVAALISEQDLAWEFVEEFWETDPNRGNFRYYDGCLYLFGLLNVTGRFQIIDAPEAVTE